MDIVFFDGRFVERSKAFIPIDDRGFLFGLGVFTTIKVNEGLIENYFEHIARLETQAAELQIMPFEVNFDDVRELIKRNLAYEGIWKLKIIVTGGPGKLSRLQGNSKGHLLMTLEKQIVKVPEVYRLIEYPHPIIGPTANIKSLAYLNRLCMTEYATSHQYDDALALDGQGMILETAFANIFWKVGKNIFIPDVSLQYLKGISIGVIEKCIKELGYELQGVKIKPHELPENAQVYVTNAMIGVIPVVGYMDRSFTRDLKFELSLQECLMNRMDKLDSLDRLD